MKKLIIILAVLLFALFLIFSRVMAEIEVGDWVETTPNWINTPPKQEYFRGKIIYSIQHGLFGKKKFDVDVGCKIVYDIHSFYLQKLNKLGWIRAGGGSGSISTIPGYFSSGCYKPTTTTTTTEIKIDDYVETTPKYKIRYGNYYRGRVVKITQGLVEIDVGHKLIYVMEWWLRDAVENPYFSSDWLENTTTTTIKDCSCLECKYGGLWDSNVCLCGCCGKRICKCACYGKQ